MRAALAIVLGAVLGCGGTAPPSPLPAGLAELTLPRDSQTLARIAADEEPTGSIARRREVLAGVSRQLLMSPPADALVPEMFDVLTALAPRIEAGAVSPAWGSYIYTGYLKDMEKKRPGGVPRRSRIEIGRALDDAVAFFTLRARDGEAPRTIEDESFDAMRSWRDERRIGR